jgi:hypothetical protein
MGKLYNIQFILTPKAEHFLIANNEDPEVLQMQLATTFIAMLFRNL